MQSPTDSHRPPLNRTLQHEKDHPTATSQPPPAIRTPDDTHRRGFLHRPHHPPSALIPQRNRGLTFNPHHVTMPAQTNAPPATLRQAGTVPPPPASTHLSTIRRRNDGLRGRAGRSGLFADGDSLIPTRASSGTCARDGSGSHFVAVGSRGDARMAVRECAPVRVSRLIMKP